MAQTPLHRVLFVAMGVLTGVAGSAVIMGQQGSPPPRRADRDSDGAYTRLGNPGPWGRLESMTVAIEPPEGYFGPEDCADALPVWLFEDLDRAGVEALFKSAGLAAPLRDRLIARTTCTAGKGCETATEADTALALDSRARETIYGRSAHAAARSPFVREPAEFDATLRRARISDATRALVERLSYRRNNLKSFADSAAVCRSLAGADEKVAFLRATVTTTSVLARLRVNEDSDVEALTSYWARGRRLKDVQPILESLSHVPGGNWIDVAHLLPSLARGRVYTFPDPSEGPKDAFWTAAAFFAPLDRAPGAEDARATLLGSGYDEIPYGGKLLLGDVILLVGARGEPTHAAVFVADDLVFTKNGPSRQRPWTLMRMSEMFDLHADAASVRVRRARGLSPNGE